MTVSEQSFFELTTEVEIPSWLDVSEVSDLEELTALVKEAGETSPSAKKELAPLIEKYNGIRQGTLSLAVEISKLELMKNSKDVYGIVLDVPVVTVSEVAPTFPRLTEHREVIGYVQGLYGNDLTNALIYLKQAGVDVIFHEKRAFESNKVTYRAFMNYLRKDDEVVVYQLVNFAKNVVYLETEASKVIGLGVSMRSLTEPWFNVTPENASTVWTVVAGLAQMERMGRAELQKYSLAKTQKAGHNAKSGRKLQIEAIEGAINEYVNNTDNLPVSKIAKKYGIDRSTLYRYLKDRNLYKPKF